MQRKCRKSCLFCAPKLVCIFPGRTVKEERWRERERAEKTEEIAHNFAVVHERTLLNVRANIFRFPKWRAHKRKFSIDFPQTVVDNNDFRRIDLVFYSIYFSPLPLRLLRHMNSLPFHFASMMSTAVASPFCFSCTLSLWRRTHLDDITSSRWTEPLRTEPNAERIRKITKSFCYILHFMFISSKTNLPTVSRTWKMSAWHRTTTRIANNRTEVRAKKIERKSESLRKRSRLFRSKLCQSKSV